MFEERGETPAERRERLRRQRKEFRDLVYKDLEETRRRRPRWIKGATYII
jgi:hypothetical protein